MTSILFGPKGKCLIKMALDTGATYTLISPEAAVSIGYHPTRARKTTIITTPTSVEYVPLIRLSKIRCLGQLIHYFDVVCHSLPPESTVDGLLGLNFLNRFNLSLFFRDHYLEIV